MAKIDFITLGKIIFGEKEFASRDKYHLVSDEEKDSAFFKLNRKFAIKYLKQAQFFNNKNINKASAIDVWYQIFYTTKGTPDWWWKTKQTTTVKIKSNINANDLKIIKDHYDLNENDINFLTKYFNEKLKEEIKRNKK